MEFGARVKETRTSLNYSQKELSENQKREDEWAATFIDKVLVRREDQFDNAWNRFDLSPEVESC